MHILYFHQHFRPAGISWHKIICNGQALIRSGHSVTMVCGSNAQCDTGLSKQFIRGRRRGIVNGIDVIEFNLKYSNQMSFAKRVHVFLKFALGSIALQLENLVILSLPPQHH